MSVNIDAVGEWLREIGQSIVMPAFKNLSTDDVEEKSPGELVTVVDHQVEKAIGQRLATLTPNLPIVGEEACAANPALLQAYYQGEFDQCWLVDPLDGTSNFAEESEQFAIMVAFIDKGQAIRSWIYQPVGDQLAASEQGSGAYINGRRIQASEPNPNKPISGSVLTRFLPPQQREIIQNNLTRIIEIPGSRCAGYDYSTIALGQLDFSLYWRLLPWDHAPGALFLVEAGGHVGHLDGRAYQPGKEALGLIAARSEATWRKAQATLLV